MSGARTRAARSAPAVTASEPEASAAAPAPAASTEGVAVPAGTNPAPDSAPAPAPAEPAEGEATPSARAEGASAPAVQDETTDAPAPVGEPLIIGVDYSSTGDLTAWTEGDFNPASDGDDNDDDEQGLIPVSIFARTVALQAASNRAPYTRGGIHFASRRTPVVLPDTTTPDQVRRLVADTAVTLSLLHVASGKSVELPRDLFSPTGEPDFDRLAVLTDDLVRQAVEAGGQA